jgi:hypothetical protein
VKRAGYYSISGAVLLGLLVRIPGIFWGFNFPIGWYGHHIDEYTHLTQAEMLINPKVQPRFAPNPYPKGMAAHVALPIIGLRLIQGKLFDNDKHPPRSAIIIPGRAISAFYGAVTVFVVFLIGCCLFQDKRVAHLAAWFIALGGLHVSQSHFFLSDVPALFWSLLGLYLLLKYEMGHKINPIFLQLAAFCFGASFGLKLVIFYLPTLALIALRREPRFTRSIQAAVFFLCGFSFINFFSYTPHDIAKTFIRGTNDPYQFSRWSSILLYLIELPSLVSFPVLVFSFAGIYFLTRKFLSLRGSDRFISICLIVILPILFNILFIVFKFDHFPRHLIPLIPFLCLTAAWSAVNLTDKIRLKGLYPGFVFVPFFVYLAIFVYDGEKVFIKEPRNKAARWMLQNVTPGTTLCWPYHGLMTGYKMVGLSKESRPSVVVMEMLHANHFLSGMGLKNSYPKDYRFVFDCPSQESLNINQSLFKGTSEYKEVARFKEGYFMPEYLLVNKLIGDRSRNYVTEIEIFKKVRKKWIPRRKGR